MRGNIIDLAVGVVIGVAFTSLVTDFTNDFINPLIKWAGGGNQLSSSTRIPGTSVVFQWGNFISAAINFLIVAAVLYFLVVLPINKLNSLRKRNAAEAAERRLTRRSRCSPRSVTRCCAETSRVAPVQRVRHRADDTRSTTRPIVTSTDHGWNALRLPSRTLRTRAPWPCHSRRP